MAAKISIIIPAYRPVSLLKDCLTRISLYTDLTNVEVIVVCNGSDRESAECVIDLGEPFRLVWYTEAIGFTRAANYGIGLARGEFILLMNTDALLLPQPQGHWIERLILPLHDKKIGITGLGIMHSGYGPFLPFYCVAMRAEMFDIVGRLDEQFGPGYGEDADWCIRAARAGYEIRQVDIVTPDHVQKMNITDFPIYHQGERSFTDKGKREEYVQKGYRRLREKYGSP